MSSALLLLLVTAGPGDVDLDVRPPPAPARQDPLAWDPSWDRFRTWEYVATGIALPGGLALRFFTQPPDNWNSPILFDEPVADALELSLGPTRDRVSLVSDVLFGASMAYRAIDDIGVVGFGHGQWDTALQMMMIDLEAFAVVAGVLWGTQVFVGRTRPYSRRCEEGVPEGQQGCASADENNRYRSFISGHPATVVAATAVTCMHHSRMPIYGGGWRDGLACGTMIGVSAATALTRIMTGSHYASDVLLGTGLGLLAGWIVPSALHYGFGGDDDGDDVPRTSLSASPRPSDPPPVMVSLVPMGPSGSAGLQVVGMLF